MTAHPAPDLANRRTREAYEKGLAGGAETAEGHGAVTVPPATNKPARNARVTDPKLERRRAKARERSQKRRELEKLYGKPGVDYHNLPRVTPDDVLAILAKRYTPIKDALESGDKEELGRALDWLDAAIAYGTLDSFEEDYEPGKFVAP